MPSHKPNILLIIADQLSHKALPVYGNRHARTPAIDSIAEQGVAFDNHFTACPLCQPARASFWTGLWPHQTGVLSNGRNYPVPQVPASTPSVGSLLSTAGYETVHFGKRHDAGALHGFHCEEIQELPAPSTEAWPCHYDSRQDEHTTLKTLEFLYRRHDTPFLCVADLNNPHDICNWIGAHQGAHSDVPVPGLLPPAPDNLDESDFVNRPLPVRYICCSHNRQAQTGGWTPENFRYYLAAYYHYVQMLDSNVGRILDALRTCQDMDNTWVVFMADHGDSMGGHGMVTKQVSFYDETTRVPFIVAGPGVAERGSVQRSALSSSMDLLPTLCDIAGVKPPDGLWGQSLRPWVAGRADGSPHEYVASEWHTEWGFTVSPGRMIRTAAHKYTRYIEDGGEELYDVAADPGEQTSRAHDPAARAQLDRHRDILRKHLEATGDSFETLSWQADSRWRSHEGGYRAHRGPAAPMVG
ncbi:MAG: sulfatase-like hydrolase/transferase [Chitinivibrionales bacterium]|nr:sulfatase-like hydrolase/transferase [Chitinivibrionales bacterium]